MPVIVTVSWTINIANSSDALIKTAQNQSGENIAVLDKMGGKTFWSAMLCRCLNDPQNRLYLKLENVQAER